MFPKIFDFKICQIIQSYFLILFLFFSLGCRTVSEKNEENSLSAAENLATAKANERKLLMERVKKNIKDVDASWQTKSITNHRGDQASYIKLEKIFNSVFEHALAAFLSKQEGSTEDAASYTKVAKTILLKLADNQFSVNGNNSELTHAWFVAKVARGARILAKMNELSNDEKKKVVNWLMKFPLMKDDDICVMDYVDDKYGGCNGRGSTNRTFSILEGRLRVYELAEQNNKVIETLKEYLDGGGKRSYVEAYFIDFKKCESPSTCQNKDFNRNDGKHPAMGMQALMQLEAIARRARGKGLGPEKKIINATIATATKDLSYTSADKISCYTGGPWESAVLIFGESTFKDTDVIKVRKQFRENFKFCKRPYHAWGYDLLIPLENGIPRF